MISAALPIARRFGFRNCFACGPDNPLGLHLVFERAADSVVCAYTPELHLGGYGRILHGGVTSMLLDEAMAWAVYGLLDRLPLTTLLRVRFLGALQAGDRLAITGRIVASDARGADGRAEIRDSTGVLRAEGEGRLRFISEAALTRITRPGP